MKQEKRRQKWVYSLLFILLVFGFCACGQKNQEQNQLLGYGTIGETYSNTGAFRFDAGLLRFQDIQSGMDVLVCDRADCSHERGSDCSAAFEALTVMAILEEDHLLLLTDYGNEKFGDKFLYEASVNGENRKQIAAFENVQQVMHALFYEDKIVFAYWNDYDENLEPLDTSEAGIYVYDRESNAGKKVWSHEKWNARILSLVYYEDAVYFNSLYSDLTKEEVTEHGDDYDYLDAHRHQDFCRVDLVTGEFRVICEDVEDITSLSVCDGWLFYNKDGVLYSYNTQTEEVKELGTAVWQLPTFLDDQTVFRNMFDFYLYSDKKGMKGLGTQESFIPVAVFPEVTYAYNYATETGNGELVYLKTEDFLKGKLDGWKTFEE